MATPTREWAAIDYYAVLGVAPGAANDEIVAAFHALAKELHPDAGPSDPTASERFKRCSAAYEVLTGDRRTDYDAYRAALRAQPKPGGERGPMPPVPPPVPASGLAALSRRTARRLLVAGVCLVVLGVVVLLLVQSLRAHDARLRSGGVPAVATVVEAGNERRYEFTTADGEVVRAPEPRKSGSGDAAVGDEVRIRYDPERPRDIVVDRSTTARDVTLWIVAVKFLLVGMALSGVAVWRMNRPEPASSWVAPESG